MADEIDYSQYAGRVVFPRGPQDLRTTTSCPACLTPLTSTVCAACGLDLQHPAAAELYETSLSAAGVLDERIRLIGRMRYETARAQAAPEVAAPVQAAASAAPPASVPAPAGVAAAGTAATDAAAMPDRQENDTVATQAPVRRRSSVQVTLLIVGVSLLSVAAIFFLVYAFINFGIVWRSVIIGAITVAAFVTASLLRRRDLTATAEGIAAFGVVLIYLDAWALRANDLFGAGSTDGALYWGMTLVVAAVAFIAWHRMSALRVPNIAGFATFAPGVGVLISSLAEPLDYPDRGFLVAAAIAVAGLVHPLARHGGKPATPERVIVLTTTAVALPVALFFAGGVIRDSDWWSAAAALGLAALAAVHVALLARTPAPTSRAFGHILSAFAGVAAASGVGIAVLRGGDTDALVLVPALAAVLVALLLEFAFHRLETVMPKTFTRTAAIGATVVAAITLLPSLVTSLEWAGRSAAGGLQGTWRREPTDVVVTAGPELGWAILALAAVGALAALAWWVGRALRRRAPLLAWWAGGTLVLAVPYLRTVGLEFGAWMLLAAVVLAALVVIRKRQATTRIRPALLATMVVAAVLGYLLGWASTSTWWIGTIVVIGVLVVCRVLVAAPGAKAALLGVAVGVALLSSGSVADHLTRETNSGLQGSLADHVILTGVVAVLALLLAALPVAWLSSLDRRVAFWVSAAVAAVALTLSAIGLRTMSASARSLLLLPEFGTSLATAAALLLALGLWVGLSANRPLRAERIVASVAIGPALYLLVTAFTRVLDLPAGIEALAPITSALLAAAGALVVTVLGERRPGEADAAAAVPSTPTPRWTRELGVALVAVPAVVLALREDGGSAWLVLVLAGVTALLLAIGRDGLFGSSSPRRHLGWLALALATAGLWWRLAGDRVERLEPYVLPLAAALVVIAVLIQWAAAREAPPRTSRVAGPVTLAGLLVAIVPLGANAASAPLGEVWYIAGASWTLLLAGSAVRGRPALQATADAAAAAGAIGVIVLAVGRAIFLPVDGIERDAWLAAAFVALLAAAFLQAAGRGDGPDRVRGLVGQWLGIVAMTAALAVEAVAFQPEPLGGIRVIALVLLFAAIHVVAWFADRSPLTTTTAWVAIAYAAIAAAVAVATDAIEPVEIVAIPIALALLATGTQHLAAVATARSWPWLGPGTAVLLLPPLVATIDDRPLWRLVGLGVVAVAVIVIAAVRRLQAPFVIGVVVVLIHGIATFLPQLRAVYEFVPWWLWLGAGGVLLIVLAARYEQRIRNLKSVALRFAALR